MSAGPPATPEGPAQPGLEPKPARPWYRRRAPLLAAGVVVVVGVTVLSDIPVHSSKSQEISADRAVMNQINGDLAGCALAAHESFEIWGTEVSGALTPSDRAAGPGLLRDDQTACSFTSDPIFELSSDVEVPGSAAGKHLGALVGTATLWATSDALGAIEDIQSLFVHPDQSATLADLADKERAAAADRREALAEMAAADHILGVRLPEPDLPALPTPTGG